MDAPLYSPAVAFVQPETIARPLSTSESAIADLQAIPAAWAVIVKAIPNIGARVGSEMIKPHLGNFSLKSLIQFGIVRPDAFDRIDADLRALGDFR